MSASPISPAVGGEVRKSADRSWPPSLQDDLEIDLRIELGRTSLAPDKLSELGPGCLVTLDSEEHDPVEIFVQGRLLARGEIVVLEDRFGVRITELVAPLSLGPVSREPFFSRQP